MDQKLLDLTPKRYLCPFCGEWHDWELSHELGYYDSPSYKAELGCENQISCCKKREIQVFFSNGYCYYRATLICCLTNLYINSKIHIEDIVESSKEPRVTFVASYTVDSDVSRIVCNDYNIRNVCLIRKLCNENNSRDIHITFGFEFDQSDYEKFSKAAFLARKEKELQEHEHAIDSKERYLKEREDAVASKERYLKEREDAVASKAQVSRWPQVKKNKEDPKMAKNANKTGLLEQLYEHSPKENVELVKQWAEKYKPTLRWAIPVVGIYAAYRILNSKNSVISVDNIGDICEKELGFSMDCLKDKAILKELMVLGGISAGAYATIKAGSTIFNTTTSSEVSVKDVENGMEKLEGAHKKFGWIQPKTEKLLPVALSVIVVYIMTQKPAKLDKLYNKVKQLTGDWAMKANLFIEMAKLFISDKLHINLEDEDEMHKAKRFIMLGAIIAVGVFLYGRKVLDRKYLASADDLPFDEPECQGMKLFIKQVLDIMKKMMPAAFAGTASWLVAKKFLCNENIDFDDISEDLRDDEEDDSADENPNVSLEDFTEV